LFEKNLSLVIGKTNIALYTRNMNLVYFQCRENAISKVLSLSFHFYGLSCLLYRSSFTQTMLLRVLY